MWWSAEGTQPADKGIKKASSKRANTLVKNHFDDVRPLQGRLCLFHVDRRFLHCVQSPTVMFIRRRWRRQASVLIASQPSYQAAGSPLRGKRHDPAVRHPQRRHVRELRVRHLRQTP